MSFYVRYNGKHDFNSYRLLVTSDRWITENDDKDIYLNLDTLGIELDTIPFTELLNLQPLPITSLKNPLFEKLYSFKFFNPIQTQVFFSLYQTDKNILIGAPTGSGKTIMSELAILHLMKESPEKKTVYIAPLKALVRERIKDWEPRFKNLKKSVV
jgi:activating signal cointegrator complex subunit 3